MPKHDMSGARNEEEIADTLTLTIRQGFPACGDELLKDLETDVLHGEDEMGNVQVDL